MAEAKDYENPWQGMREELGADLPDHDTPETDQYNKFKQQAEEERETQLGGRAASPNIEPPPAVEHQDSVTPQPKYDIPDGQRGIALIISNNTFRTSHSPPEVCEGTEHDVNALEMLWNDLHFDTRVLRDQTAEEMRGQLRSLAKLEGYRTDVKCVVVCILSHGRNRFVVGSDNSRVTIDNVVKLFYNDEVHPSLRGQPKMFFIQACRGTNKNISKAIQDPASVETVTVVAVPTDILCLSAKTTGCTDWRTLDRTSLFIHHLVEVFAEHHTKVDVDSMMGMVVRKTKEASDGNIAPEPYVSAMKLLLL